MGIRPSSGWLFIRPAGHLVHVIVSGEADSKRRPAVSVESQALAEVARADAVPEYLRDKAGAARRELFELDESGFHRPCRAARAPNAWVAHDGTLDSIRAGSAS